MSDKMEQIRRENQNLLEYVFIWINISLIYNFHQIMIWDLERRIFMWLSWQRTKEPQS